MIGDGSTVGLGIERLKSLVPSQELLIRVGGQTNSRVKAKEWNGCILHTWLLTKP